MSLKNSHLIHAALIAFLSVTVGCGGNNPVPATQGVRPNALRPKTGTFYFYSTGAGTQPRGFTFAPSGDIYFTPFQTAIGELKPNGRVHYYRYKSTTRNQPAAITLGPDGNIWFTDFYAGDLARLSQGKLNFWWLADGYTSGLVSGPHHHLWIVQTGFCDCAPSSISEIRPKKHKVLNNYFLPDPCNSYGPVIAGSDGNLWVGGSVNPYDGTCDPKYHPALLVRVSPIGKMTPFAMPGFAVYAIANGPDGNIWFTMDTKIVGKITPSGQITTYPIDSWPGGIAAGPTGTLWFSEPYMGELDNITTDGAITKYPIPGAIANSQPNLQLDDVKTRPDGSVWFTEPRANGIGKFIP